SSGTSTPRERVRHREYWRAAGPDLYWIWGGKELFRFGSRRVVWIARTLTRSASTPPSLSVTYGNRLDHSPGDGRALREGWALPTAVGHRRVGLARKRRRLGARGHVREDVHPRAPVLDRAARPGPDVWQRSRRRACEHLTLIRAVGASDPAL